MKTKHTPGPWKVGLPFPNIYGPKGEHVANCQHVTNFDENNGANAKLIAAAPELLEIAQAMALWLGAEAEKGYPKESMAAFSVPVMVSKAWAAIAKATQ